MMKRSSVVAQSVFPVSGEASRTASRCRTLAASVFAIVSFVCFSGLCRPAIGQAVSKDQLATLGEARVRRHVDAVPRNECFPVESLPESSRRLSQQLLLDALDSEALYTFVGDLKPISEGFFRTWFQLEPVDTQELESVRAAMSSWKCGDCYDAGVLPFQNSRGGERYASGWIASRSAVREKLKQHAEFFGRLGMTVDSDAESLLLRIEGADQPGERWRGFGLLFGYPKRAVDFFVRAGMHHATTGEFVERDFRNFPTHSGSSGRFVYAVPRLTKESAGELKVRRMVEAILTQYRQRRAKYVIDESSNRVAELIRDWFDDGSGWCHPDHAMQKAVAWDVARTWVEEKSIPLKTVRPSDSLEDLQQLAPLFDAPRIIAMGESTHGTREFFQLKHRLFRYLVENHGVRLFGLEASYAACLPINNYIVSGDGDPRAAIKGQGFWTWDTEEVLALVEWMRAWNESRDPTTEPLRFYGFDTQDAYTPLNAVLTELAEHSPDVADQFRKRFAIALDEQYGGKWNDATRAQLDDLLISAKELRSVCEGINNRSAADRGRHRLLLQQATAAIAGRRANLDHWSSLGRVKEVELYDRIRSGLPQIESFVTSLTGPEAQTLLQLVRAAEDLQSCQIRFRDQLNPAEREQWRNAVQWSIQVADSPDVRKVLTDLRKFLEVSTEYLRKPKELTNQRDRAMAQFVASILEQHGGDSRIALWAHDWHVSKFDGDPTEDVPRMGTFLQREFADDYFPVGLSFGSGGFQSKYFPQEDEDVSRLALRAFEVNGSRADSFSYLLDYCDSSVSAHVLSSNQELPSWFAEPHFYRSIGAAYQPKLALTESYYEKVVLPKHFELVLHVKKTERARPLSPVPKFRFGAKFVNEREEEQTNASDTVPAVVVASVLPKSIAEQCGLRVDDQIVGVSEQRVRDVDEFQRTLATIDRPGSHVLEILRLAGDENAGSARQRLVLYFTVPPWITD